MTPSSRPTRVDAIDLPVERSTIFDPPDGLRALRETEPIRRLRWPDGTEGWVVSSHALAQRILTDDRFRKDVDWYGGSADRPGHPRPTEDADQRRHRLNPPPVPTDSEILRIGAASHAGNIIEMEPPLHTRVRQQLATSFTVKRVAELRPDIERIASEACDEMLERGAPLDVVTAYAIPIPLRSICRLVGVPDSDRGLIHDLDDTGDGYGRSDIVRLAHAIERAMRREPTGPDTLLTRLRTAGELTEEETLGAAILVALAGFHTTFNLIATSLFALLADRRQWEQLRADRSLLPGATDELMRYLTITNQDAHTRMASEDVEIDGTLIREGDWVYVSLPAANRDPAAFENPDELDFTRDPSGHVGFGYGRHQCLGQNLVRLEMEVGLGVLMDRIPDLRLLHASEAIPMPLGNAPLHSPKELGVTWG